MADLNATDPINDSNSAKKEPDAGIRLPSAKGRKIGDTSQPPVLQNADQDTKPRPLLQRQGSRIDRLPSVALRRHHGHAKTFILTGWQSGVVGSCLNLSSTILGAGILALPLTGVWLGLIPMLAMLLTLGLANAYSCKILLLVGAYTRSYTFEEATDRTMGYMTGRILDVCIFLRSLIVLASSLIFTSDFLMSLGNALVNWLRLDVTLNKSLLITLVTVLVMYPLALMRSMNSLALFSGFKMVCLWLFAAVVVFLSAQNMWAGKQQPLRLVAPLSWQWQRPLPIAAFSYHSQVNLFPIYAEVKSGTIRKGHQMITSSYVICTVLYVMVATFGYLHFPTSHYGNYLRNFDDVAGDVSGEVIHVLRASFLIVTVFTFPMLLFAARIALHALLWPQQERMSSLQSFVITTVITAVSLAISLATDDIALILGIGGSLFTSYVSMILPAQLYLRVLDMRSRGEGAMLSPQDTWTDHVDLERLIDDESATQIASAFEIAMRPEQIKYEKVKAVMLLLTGLIVGVVGLAVTLLFR